MSLNLFVGNDSVLELNVREPIFKNDLSGAAANYEIVDEIGQAIDNGVMSFTGASTVNNYVFYLYRAEIDSAVNLLHGANYIVKVTFDNGEGVSGLWEIKAIARARSQ